MLIQRYEHEETISAFVSNIIGYTKLIYLLRFFVFRDMATHVAQPRDQLGADELERGLSALISHVQQEKERARSSFQQLHSLLTVKEHDLLQEIDETVELAMQEIEEKKKSLKELDTARQSLENDLTRNNLRDVLDRNLRTLEDKIREELSRGVSVGWIELCWKKEQLEYSVDEVCKVVTMRERPFRSEDYSLKLRPVWSREGTERSLLKHPQQIAIDNTTQNIFVSDNEANSILVYNGEGNHLYSIPTAVGIAGIALTEEYIFVSAKEQLVKMRKSTNKSVKSVQTESRVWGIEITDDSTIYGCEVNDRCVILFDDNLKFLKRVQLKTTLIEPYTSTNSLKLYANSLYVMFSHFLNPPLYHLQIFSMEGELVRCLIPEPEIVCCDFFSMDRLGNIIVADWGDDRIQIFSKEGLLLHSINSDMLPGDMKLSSPSGVAISSNNKIIIAHKKRECCLIAF